MATLRKIGRDFNDVQRQMKRYLRSQGYEMVDVALPSSKGIWHVYAKLSRTSRPIRLTIKDSDIRGS